MKTIVLISGAQGSGKSTTANLIRSEMMSRGIIAGVFKFASPLYDMHGAINNILKNYGLESIKGIDGALLQYLGTDWGRRRFGDDIWVRGLRNSLKYYWELNKNALIIINDVRFPNELDAFDYEYQDIPILKVRLNCGKAERQRRTEKWREGYHVSEHALDDASFDLTIDTEVNRVDSVAAEILKWILKIQN